MSAYVVGPAHIDAILRSAKRYGSYWGNQSIAPTSPDVTLTDLGRDLLRENIASVSHRYSHRADVTSIAGTTADTYEFRSSLTPPLSPVALLKAITCYTYQSCEHPDWQESAAKSFCDTLTSATITALPGYNDAEWEITS